MCASSSSFFKTMRFSSTNRSNGRFNSFSMMSSNSMLRFVSHCAINFNSNSPTLVRIFASASCAIFANVGITILSRISSSYTDLWEFSREFLYGLWIFIEYFIAVLPIIIHDSLEYLQRFVSNFIVLHIEESTHKFVQFKQPLGLGRCNLCRFVLHEMHDRLFGSTFTNVFNDGVYRLWISSCLLSLKKLLNFTECFVICCLNYTILWKAIVFCFVWNEN